MAYETSTATNVDGLLEAFRVFAVAQGWTVDHYDTNHTVTDGVWLALHKGTAYFDLYTDNSPASYAYGDLCIMGATGYDGGQDYLNQPGMRTDNTASTGKSSINDLAAGPYVAYHFFAGTDFIHAAVEVSSGRYTHFGIGTLNKAATYDGGEYHFGTWWYLDNVTYSGAADYTGHVYPFGSSTKGTLVRFTENDLNGTDAYKDWAYVYSSAISSSTTRLYAQCFSQAITGGLDDSYPLLNLVTLQPNYFNGASMLIPFSILCGRRNGLTCMLGEPPEIAYLNIHHYAAGEEITIGSDTWIVFPTKQKGEQIVGNTTPFSLWHGIAYKKVV